MSRKRRFAVLIFFGLVSFYCAIVYGAPLLGLAGAGWWVLAFFEK